MKQHQKYFTIILFVIAINTNIKAYLFLSLPQDSLIVQNKKEQKFFIRIGGRNLLVGIPPFVAQIDIMHQLSPRLNVGIYSYFTKKINPLLYYRISKGNFVNKNPQYNSYYYIPESSIFFLMNNKPYEHWAIGLSTEYKLIQKFWKNKSLLIQSGLSYTQGATSTDILYKIYISNYVSSVWGKYYSVVLYKNIALDTRIRVEKYSDELVTWSLSWYTSFIPTMITNKNIFLGWLFEMKIKFKNKKYAGT